MTSSAEALDLAKQLTSSALGPSASIEAKRKFQEHLITLPSYPVYENKAYFGTLVAKLFGEFEDLQDSAIDALLDLCEDEDEKVRIIGIKGLGPTGRADPRWVRGNTGVLLQLLACQPRELRYVKESLQLLMSVSPKEVFSVMIDDCKNSEEETGASRRNILKYIQNDLADQRREMFQMGNNLEVEDIFRQGLFDLLENASEEESKTIRGLLKPMSTVSSKNASEESKKKYLKALIKSTPPGSPVDKVLLLITSFKNYVARFASIDPRIAISFLARHGDVVVKQCMGRSGFTSRWVVDKLIDWTREAVDRWAVERDDRELSEESLAPAFVKTVLPSFLDECKILLRKGDLFMAGNVIEPILYAIYRLTTNHDRRSQIIHHSDRDPLKDLAREALRLEKRAPKGSSDAERWANVVDMAEILADDRAKIAKIKPSWDKYSKRVPSGPSSSQPSPVSQRNTTDAKNGSTIPPAAPRGPKALPSGPRNGNLEPSSTTPRNAPTGPSNNGIRSSTPAGPSNTAQSRSHHDVSKRPPTPERRPRSPDRRPRSPDRRRLSPARSQQSSDGTGFALNGRQYSPPLPKGPRSSQQFNSAVGLQSNITLKADAVLEKSESKGNNLSIKNGALPRQDQEKPKAAISTTTGQAASASTQSPSNIPEKQLENPISRGSSLADRLGVSTSSTASTHKRPRQNDETKSDDSRGRSNQSKDAEKPSLLSRLGSKEDDAPQAKRAKEDIPKVAEKPNEGIKEEGGRLSLFDRINRNSSVSGTTSTQSSSIQPLTSSSSSTLPVDSSSNIKAENQPDKIPTSNKGLNILNRSATSSPQLQYRPQEQVSNQGKGLSFLSRSTSSQNPTPPSAPKQGFSILNRASSSSSPNIDIRSSSPPKVVAEEGVVRKGRGFRARTPEGVDIVMSNTTPPIAPSHDRLGGNNSSLAGRLSNEFNGGGIRGRGRGGPGGNFSFGWNGRG